ncbi:fimbrial protein [Luteibacter aegosomaticola]|uniref:fimbrial protein n=1 Tax=Luteibacter aegosomaticola TaxID=2911538 RepID=UPI001FF85A0A|nr:fimbrial protein [Luteibacter aegosomaticola]UPG90358.1 fimbrial protein [Luteibacter aegosomaticola]
MISSPMARGHQRRLFVFALLAAPAGSAFAADNGCYHSYNGYYEIDPPGSIIVSEAIPAGEVVRDYSANGKGDVLGSCMAGTATFEGGYTVPVSDDLVPLTVGGAASGFGVRLRIEERADARTFPFPHRYTRRFALGDPIRVNDVSMGVEIVRMPGPITFGKVDHRTIAQQWTYQPDGTKTAPLRHVSTTNIVFARASCSLVPADLTQTVKLTPISTSAFANADRATSWEPFHIAVADCSDPKGMIARFTFGVAGDADSAKPELFSLSGPRNVGLELANKDKQNIAPAKPVDMQALATGERFDFYVRMRETRNTVEAGVFTRPVKVDVEFR